MMNCGVHLKVAFLVIGKLNQGGSAHAGHFLLLPINELKSTAVILPQMGGGEPKRLLVSCSLVHSQIRLRYFDNPSFLFGLADAIVVGH